MSAGWVAHLGDVTVSMRMMSAGDRYQCLLRTVAAGDGVRWLSMHLTRYYTEEGTPRGSKSTSIQIGVILSLSAIGPMSWSAAIYIVITTLPSSPAASARRFACAMLASGYHSATRSLSLPSSTRVDSSCNRCGLCWT